MTKFFQKTNSICRESDVVLTYLGGFFSKEEEEAVLKHINNCSICFGILLDEAKSSLLTIEFCSENLRTREVVRTKAAGMSEKLPPEIKVPQNFISPEENISIKFEKDSNELKISIIGGTLATRKKIKLQIHYAQMLSDLLEGKDIARGGSWKISQDKAEQISHIVLLH